MLLKSTWNLGFYYGNMGLKGVRGSNPTLSKLIMALYENWDTYKLYTAKECWKYLETDFMMKKYDQCFKKIEKRQFLDFWAKNQAD